MFLPKPVLLQERAINVALRASVLHADGNARRHFARHFLLPAWPTLSLVIGTQKVFKDAKPAVSKLSHVTGQTCNKAIGPLKITDKISIFNLRLGFVGIEKL